MCGIVAKLSTQKQAAVNLDIADQFDEQRSRGVKGFGFIGIDQEGYATVRRAREEPKILADLYKTDYPAIVFHHRLPTSTENTQRQTHPMYISADTLVHDYLVVHNGVIRNADELKELHEELGFKYLTAVEEVTRKWHGPKYVKGVMTQKGEYVDVTEEAFNDSEALAIEVARVIEGHTNEIGALGSVAFIAVQLDKKNGKVTNYMFGRNNSNPLNMFKTKTSISLSSEGMGQAIEPFVLHTVAPGSVNVTKHPLAFVEPAPVKTSVPVAAAKTVGFAPRTAAAVTVAQSAAKKETSSSPTAKPVWETEQSVSKEAQEIFNRVDETESEQNNIELYLGTVIKDRDVYEQAMLDELFFEYDERFTDEVFSTLQLDVEKGLCEDSNYRGQNIKACFARIVDNLIDDIRTSADNYLTEKYAEYLLSD